MSVYSLKFAFCLQSCCDYNRKSKKKEEYKENECRKRKNSGKKLEKNPKAVMFSGFQTKATTLASVRKELYKMIPEAKSVVFSSSRSNQDTLSRWVNFDTAME